MKTIEYRTIEKDNWPRGAWDDECDKYQFTDEATGLPCLIVRNPTFGNLCGYVGVHKGHRFYRKPFHKIDADVHGGPTFADHCQPNDDEARGICHIDESDDRKVWWIGFDCGHGGDMMPAMTKRYGVMMGETYCDVEFVREQVRALAEQLATDAKA